MNIESRIMREIRPWMVRQRPYYGRSLNAARIQKRRGRRIASTNQITRERTMKNTDIVAAIYAAFGQGDIPGVLNHLDDNVDWEYTATYDDLPWYQRRKGKAGAAQFFQSLADFEFNQFQPRAILDAPGGLVVSVVAIDLTLKRNGARIAIPDEIHLFYFNEAGKVVKFAHRVDTMQFYKAMQA
jgi:ketosteroid isomerase-like protein